MTIAVPLRDDLFVWPEGAEQPTALRAARCRSCAAVAFPYVPACRACDAGGPVESIALSRDGTVFEVTTVRVGAPGFTAPYDVGYVDLPEGIRVFTQLATDGKRHARSGDAVRLAFRPWGERGGTPVIGFEFRLR